MSIKLESLIRGQVELQNCMRRRKPEENWRCKQHQRLLTHASNSLNIIRKNSKGNGFRSWDWKDCKRLQQACLRRTNEEDILASENAVAKEFSHLSERNENITPTTVLSPSPLTYDAVSHPIAAFFGNYEDWPPFQDFFRSVIGNDIAITKVE